MSRIAIIDSGGANIASLLFACERLGVDATLTSDAAIIRDAERVILPGVGAAKDAMNRLAENKLTDLIRGLRQPVLGICLGLQLLLEGSEEENVECLGIIPGVARKLLVTPGYPVPNMGWCETHVNVVHPLLHGIPSGSYFYYVHSYALPLSVHTLATADHSRRFSAVVAKDNFVASQFHPERSSAIGAQVLRNFLGANP